MEYAKPLANYTTMPKITFCKKNLICNLPKNIDLLRASFIDSSIPLKFGCRQGNCGTCTIKILKGEENLSPKTKEEVATLQRLGLSSHHRLACQCALMGDIEIDH